MPDTGAESGFTKQGPQKETEQTQFMEMLLIRKPTARIIVSLQWHEHTHCYVNPPIHILIRCDESMHAMLNVQLTAAVNAQKCFACRVHLSLSLGAG